MIKQTFSFFSSVKYIILFTILFATYANASNSVGSVDSTNKYGKVCKDVTCSVFGRVNFNPSPVLGATSVVINDTSITGNAWGDEIGWINMNPSGLTAGDTLKVDPNTGVVTGKAYSNTGSWINFSPAGAGVTLVDNGSGSNFSGYAWVSGLYGGWMKFDCSNAASCVKTDWRTIPNRIVPVVPVTNNNGSLIYSPEVNSKSVTITKTQELITKVAEVLGLNPDIPASTQINTNAILNENENENRNIAPEENAKIEDKQDYAPTFPTETTTTDSLEKDPDPEGRYKQVFPFYGGDYTMKECIFCIVIRRDSYSRATSEGDVVILGEKRILKYGFIPKALEVPISYSPDNSKLKLDLVSVAITAAGGWVFRRYLLARLLVLFAKR